MPNNVPVPPSPPSPIDCANDNAPEKRRSRKPVLWLAAIGLFALALVICSFDELPSDASDLIVKHVTVPDEENGILLLGKTAEDASASFASNDTDFESLSHIYNGKKWDEARVTAWLTAFEPFEKRYIEAAQKPLGQIPPITSPAENPLPFAPLRKLTGLSLVHARKQLRDGNPDAALSTAAISLSAGKLIQTSNGMLITYMIGSAIKNPALSVIEDAARHPDVSTNELRSILAKLAAARDLGDDFKNSIRGERQFVVLLIKLIGKDGPKPFGLNSVPDSLSRLLVKIPLFFKPNKIARIHNQGLREAIAMVGLDYTSLSAEIARAASTRSTNKFSEFNPDNIVGRIIFETDSVSWPQLVKIRLRGESRISVLEAFVAARIYQREHGELPATLDLIVPNYLPAVPTDYSDGAPIRYSAALGVIWAAGESGLKVVSSDQKIAPTEVVVWITDRKSPAKESAPPTASETPAPTPES